MWDLIRRHPRAVLVALLIHLLLLAFFIINVDWHRDTPAAAQPIKARAIIDPKAVAELQKQIPDAPEPPPEDEQKRQEQEAAEQERLEEEKKQAELARQRAEEEQQAELKRKQEAERKKQADLQRKQEQEKKRLAEQKRKKLEEEKRKQAAEKKRLAEEKKRKEAERRKKLEAEKKRKEAERRKKLAEEKRRKEEERLRAQELALEEQRMNALFAEEQAELEQAQVAGLRSRYIGAIKSRVESRWLQPAGGVTGSCEVKVKQASTGRVLDVQVLSSSTCSGMMRDSVEKAVWRADPLPKAPDSRVFEREINFIFEPQT